MGGERSVWVELTDENLSVGVSEDIEVVPVSRVVAILHQTSNSALAIAGNVTLGGVE